MQAFQRFFGRVKNFSRETPIRNVSRRKMGVGAGIGATVLGLSTLLTSTASAYNDAAKPQTTSKEDPFLQVGTRIKEKRLFILSRFDFVCSKLGMTPKEKETAFNSFFQHLRDDESLQQVLTVHRAEASKIIKERGPAVFIDHTLLKADATEAQVQELCKEAQEYSFGSVCVNGGRATTATSALEKSNVNVAVVIGFPLGASTTVSKRAEATEVWFNGCQEIDMVLDIGKMKDGNYTDVKDQIAALVWDSQMFSSGPDNHVVKVIFETCLLTKAEIVDAAILSVLARATVVKTSTGFSTGGADVADVEMMRLVVGNRLGVKASGGIRDKETMTKMIQSGASLIGTSSGVSLCKDSVQKGSFPRRRSTHCFEQTGKE